MGRLSCDPIKARKKGAEMSFLYVTNPKAKIFMKDNQIVHEEENLTTKIPIETLEGVIAIGNLNMTVACSKELLKRGIPTTYLATNGQYFGRLESTRHSNITRQRLQFRRGDDPAFRLALSKNFVQAKAHNQLVIMRRRFRTDPNPDLEKAINQVKILQKKIPTAQDISQLMGYEGNIARIYFSSLGKDLPETFRFSGRNKQPPRDPFNSMLSFGYTLLMYECYNALINKGLHPYAGFLHADRDRHPSLASDIMEEWRPVLIDSLVLSIADSQKFTQDDFTQDPAGGVYLKRDLTKKFIQLYTKKLQDQQSYIQGAKAMSFQKAIIHQIERLIQALETNDPTHYQGIKIR